MLNYLEEFSKRILSRSSECIEKVDNLNYKAKV